MKRFANAKKIKYTHPSLISWSILTLVFVPLSIKMNEITTNVLISIHASGGRMTGPFQPPRKRTVNSADKPYNLM